VCNSTSVYLDNWGNVYAPDVQIDSAQFANGQANLWNYYRHLTGSRLHPGRAREENVVTRARWAALASRYGIAQGPDQWPQYQSDTSWITLQDSVVARLRRAVGVASNNGQLPLLVLIHGFNAQDASPSYTDLTRAIFAQEFERIAPDSVALLRVYWDGSDGSRSRVPLQAWWNGQANAFPVGLSVRRFLNSLPERQPVRIITHSLGSTVASAALWNLDVTINKRQVDASAAENWYAIYLARQSDATRYATPRLVDLRVGMLVPAMPAETFLDAQRRTPSSNAMPYQRIVVGVNPRDYAIQHAEGKMAVGCADRVPVVGLGLGGDCAAADSSADRAALRSGCPRAAERTITFIDFHGSKKTPLYAPPPEGEYEAHSLSSYVGRDAFPAFLRAVFTPTAPGKSSDGC
jgi:hypothetical protein